MRATAKLWIWIELQNYLLITGPGVHRELSSTCIHFTAYFLSDDLLDQLWVSDREDQGVVPQLPIRPR